MQTICKQVILQLFCIVEKRKRVREERGERKRKKRRIIYKYSITQNLLERTLIGFTLRVTRRIFWKQDLRIPQRT